MSYYMRLIKHIKSWPDDPSVNIRIEEIGADAITELATDKNTLSWWHIKNLDDEDFLIEIATAILSTFNELPHATYLIFIDSEVLEKTLDIKNTPKNAHTLFNDMKNLHHDSINMNYKSLGQTAVLIAKGTAGLDKKIFVKKIPREKIIAVLKKRVESGSIDITKIKPNIQNYLTE